MQINARIHNPFIHYGLLVLIYAVGFATLFGHTILHAATGHEHTSGHSQVAGQNHCENDGLIHEVVFTDRGILLATMTVERCAVIRIKNLSSQRIIPALGSHDNHVKYPGFRETYVQPHTSYSFRVSEPGSYVIHDHSNGEAKATIIIKN